MKCNICGNDHLPKDVARARTYEGGDIVEHDQCDWRPYEAPAEMWERFALRDGDAEGLDPDRFTYAALVVPYVICPDAGRAIDDAIDNARDDIEGDLQFFGGAEAVTALQVAIDAWAEKYGETGWIVAGPVVCLWHERQAWCRAQRMEAEGITEQDIAETRPTDEDLAR